MWVWNYRLIWLQYSGLIQHWADVENNEFSNLQRIQKDEHDEGIFHLAELQVAFYLLLFGLSTAGVVFAIELVTKSK